MRSARGYTLLELLTVLAILGILVAVAIPSFRYLNANTRVKNTATNLYLTFLRARSEAVKRDKRVIVQAINGNWASGWQVLADADADPTTYEKVVYEVSARNAAVAISEANSNTVFTYLPSGRITGAQPSFTIDVSGGRAFKSTGQAAVRRCVTADLTGRPSSNPC